MSAQRAPKLFYSPVDTLVAPQRQDRNLHLYMVGAFFASFGSSEGSSKRLEVCCQAPLTTLLPPCSMGQCHGGLLENLLLNALEYDLAMALANLSQKEASRIRLAQKTTPVMMKSWFLMAQGEIDCGKELPAGNHSISTQKGRGKWFYIDGTCRTTKGRQATCLEQT